jgi:hypothetical protein
MATKVVQFRPTPRAHLRAVRDAAVNTLTDQVAFVLCVDREHLDEAAPRICEHLGRGWSVGLDIATRATVPAGRA